MVLQYSPIPAWIARKTGLAGNLTPATLRAWQISRLQETLAFVKERSRHYAETLRDIEPERIQGPEDLARLPFTDEADLREAGTRLVCVPQSEVARIMTLNTSGTRGTPKRICFSEADQEACVDFFAVGMQSMVEPGDCVATFLGPLNPGNTVDLLRQGLERIGVSTQILTDTSLSAAQCFVGMPVPLFRMAKLNPALRPKSVLLCADYVPNAIRNAIREIWACEVFSHYGSTESGLGGGVECRAHDGLHLRDADLLFEIVDPATGQPVPDNTPGELVFSTLSRTAMPLVRYRTGDLACMTDAPCACGSRLRRLDKLTGRKSACELSIARLDEAFFSQPEALDYAAKWLEANASLRIRAEIQGTVQPEALARRIKGSLGLDISIQVELVSTPLPVRLSKRTLQILYT